MRKNTSVFPKQQKNTLSRLTLHWKLFSRIMAGAKFKAATSIADTSEVETISSHKKDSTIAVKEDIMTKVNMTKFKLQIWNNMFQDTINNIAMLKCANFNILAMLFAVNIIQQTNTKKYIAQTQQLVIEQSDNNQESHHFKTSLILLIWLLCNTNTPLLWADLG